ncbi:MAG: hypothetical protein V1899_04885 [Planctomycetota bacterium]
MTSQNHARPQPKLKNATPLAEAGSTATSQKQEIQLPSPTTASDDLSIQPLEPTTSDKFAPKHLTIAELSDKPKFHLTIIGDNSHLLVLFFVVLVAVVLISMYILCMGQDSPRITPTTTATLNAKKTTASSSVASTGKTATSDAKTEDPTAAYISNPANRECLHGFLNFMAWTYSEAGIKLNGTQIAAKFQTEVPVNLVNDPQVREIHALTLESFNLAKNHPQGRLDSSGFIANAPVGQSILISNERMQQWRKLIMRIKVLSHTACQRYGDPVSPPAK